MIYLIRHGQTDWNLDRKLQGQTDIPLNDNGREQAEDAAKEISKLKIDRIISSDLLRAKETAEIINKKIGKEISFDKRLREVNFGDYERKLIETIKDEDWDVFNQNPEKKNGESRKHVYERVKSFLQEINEEENVLVVTHGGALRMMLYYAGNKEKFDMTSYDEFTKDYWISNAKVIYYKEN